MSTHYNFFLPKSTYFNLILWVTKNPSWPKSFSLKLLTGIKELFHESNMTNIFFFHSFSFRLCFFEESSSPCLDFCICLFTFYWSIPTLSFCFVLFDFWSSESESFWNEIFSDHFYESISICRGESSDSYTEVIYLIFHISTSFTFHHPYMRSTTRSSSYYRIIITSSSFLYSRKEESIIRNTSSHCRHWWLW